MGAVRRGLTLLLAYVVGRGGVTAGSELVTWASISTHLFVCVSFLFDTL